MYVIFMPRLIVFNHVSVDGYFTDASGEMTFAHPAEPDPDFDAFTASNARGEGCLVFGRKTYEMMASFWPSPAAKARMAVVAERMNHGRKLVFSRTLKTADWTNTELVTADPVKEIARRRKATGPDMVVLGSGEIVSQLAGAGLVDEFQMIVAPVALGSGRTLFEGLEEPLRLKKEAERGFKNGRVFIRYTPLR